MAQKEEDTRSSTGIQYESGLEGLHINITLTSRRVLKDQRLDLEDTVFKLISTICEEHDDVTHQPNEITLICENGENGEKTVLEHGDKLLCYFNELTTGQLLMVVGGAF